MELVEGQPVLRRKPVTMGTRGEKDLPELRRDEEANKKYISAQLSSRVMKPCPNPKIKCDYVIEKNNGV